MVDEPLARADAPAGGVAARRAVVRWALRLFRREWRQQTLVLTLLTLAVASAIAGMSVAYNVAPLRAAEFGSADQMIKFDGSDPATLEANLATTEEAAGTTDVIAHWSAPVPGSVEFVALRAQDPQGPYSGPMLRLLDGRYPATPAEVAVTDDVATVFDLEVGSQLVLGPDEGTVAGIVENPSDLADEFVLMAPGAGVDPEFVTVLLSMDGGSFEALEEETDGLRIFESRGRSLQATAGAGIFAVATVVLLLVSLVTAAGFAVVAQRRLRQLGMLSAIGATEKHMRLVMLANGLVVGVIAAVIGAALGIAASIAVAPRLESAAEHRIDRFGIPWWLVAPGMVLAVVTAIGAAWWPARAAAKVPTMLALSGRPPRPRAAHRSAMAAVVLLAAGVGCLALANQTNPLFIISGTILTVLGILFISPVAIQVLAALSGRFSVGVRLALRDLARHQARAGAALAAISLALGIPIAIVITATAAEDAADAGNLSDRQMLVYLGNVREPVIPLRSPDELAVLESEVERLAAPLGDATVVPLDMAVEDTVEEIPAFDGDEQGRPAVELGEPTGGDSFRAVPAYVATPELIEYLGVDPDSIDPDADVLSVRTGELVVGNVSSKGEAVRPVVQRIDGPAYSSAPTTVILTDAVEEAGWVPTRAGWLVESSAPLTGEQVSEAREIAADAGLAIEARRDQSSLAVMRSGATAAGMVLALGVLAITVGLIRSEAAGDLRTLTAAGATSRVRRTLTSATALGLAFLGVVLGTAGAYLGLIGGYLGELGTLGRVPLAHLAVTLVGVPVVAAVAGWLLAGREPPALARHPIE